MSKETTQFKPGQSGNPGGRPKAKPFDDALRAELIDAGDDGVALIEIARSLIAEAKGGNLQAIREIADRLDGRPAQSVDLGITPMAHEDWLAQLQ